MLPEAFKIIRLGAFAVGVPFGGGRHRCIGATFAYQQVKVIWSILLRKFEFELSAGPYQPQAVTSLLVPGWPETYATRKLCEMR